MNLKCYKSVILHILSLNDPLTASANISRDKVVRQVKELSVDLPPGQAAIDQKLIAVALIVTRPALVVNLPTEHIMVLSQKSG